MGSIPGPGTKIHHAESAQKKKKRKKERKKEMNSYFVVPKEKIKVGTWNVVVAFPLSLLEILGNGQQRWKCSKEAKSNNGGSDIWINHKWSYRKITGNIDTAVIQETQVTYPLNKHFLKLQILYYQNWSITLWKGKMTLNLRLFIFGDQKPI